MAELYGSDFESPRFFLTIMSSLAALALVTAAVGLGGVLSFAIQQRRREIGVRLALGAAPWRIRTLVLRHAVGSVAAGLAIGALAAIWLGPLVADQLYRVTPRDPLTFVACGAFLVLVALAAALVPMRTAARIDPISALRVE